MNDFSALIQDTLDHLKSCYRKDDLLFVSDESYLHFFREPKKIGEAATLKKTTPLQVPIAQRPLQRDKPLIKPSPLPSTPSQVVVHQLPRQSPLKHEETFSTAMSSKINKLLPSVKIARQVPSDEEAIRLKSLWKQPKKELFTIILHDKEMGPCLDFLHNVSKAVSERLCPSLVIDASQWNESGVWSSLFEKHNPSLIVASKQLLSSASLSVFLREDTTHNLFYLKEIPLIVLDPIQTYLTHPLAKKALWNTLCHHLKT